MSEVTKYYHTARIELLNTTTMLRRVMAAVIASLLFSGFINGLVSEQAYATLTVENYPVTFQNLNSLSGPIAAGSDGKVWFAANIERSLPTKLTDEVVLMTEAGDFAQYQVPLQIDYPLYGIDMTDLVVGSDGSLWFADRNGNQVVRLSTIGQFQNYMMPSGSAAIDIAHITAGPDEALWFTLSKSSQIGRITTAGQMDFFNLPSADYRPYNIAGDASNSLWFSTAKDTLGRINVTGKTSGISLSGLKTSPDSILGVGSIALGPDNNIWFIASDRNSDYSVNRYTINKVDPLTELVTTYEYNEVGDPRNLTIGPDGALWFTISSLGNQLGRISTDGDISTYAVYSTDGVTTPSIAGITTGSDNTLWLSTVHPHEIIKVEISSLTAPQGLNVLSPAQNPALSWTAVTSATSYNIYRNDTVIKTTTNTTYVDDSAPEGLNTYHITATDTSDESEASNVVEVLVDRTPPTNSTLTWSANPLPQGQSTVLSILADDDSSGIQSVSYTLNNGISMPMAYDSATDSWHAPLGSNLLAGTYSISVTAIDQAGNSTIDNDILAVYNSANGYVTGHAKVVPNNNDDLPIEIDTSSNPTNIVVGFTNVTSPTSGNFDLEYKIKNNQNEFNLSSTSINWVVVQSSTQATIRGTADMTVYQDGVKTVTQNMPVNFDIAVDNTGEDHLVIKIFAPSSNPSSSSPLYVINSSVQSNGSNLMIHQ